MTLLSRFWRLLAERLENVGRLRLETCQASIHLRRPVLPLAFTLFLLWLIVRPGPFPLAGAAFCGSLLIIGLAWVRTMATQVSTRRVLRFTALQVGDHLEEELFLENRSTLPVVFAEFIDQSTLPGYAVHGVRVGRRRGSEQWRLQTICNQRGVFSLGRWEVRLGDPFGIFEARQVYRHDEEITVYPPLAVLPEAIGRHHRTLGDRLVLRQALPADTVSAMTTRPYAAGDSLSRIHWRTTARHDDLFVRIFEPEASSVMWLLLDLDEAVHVGEGPESSMEKMIMAAASLAASLLHQKVAVGMVLEAEGTQVVSPRTGKDHLWTILRALAMIRPGRTPLATALAHAASVVSRRDSASILTPSLDPAWIGMLPALIHGARGGLEVWLFDPASFGGRGKAVELAEVLRGQGTPMHVLRRDDVRQVLGAFDKLRRWEFRTLATGRAVPLQTPRSPAVPAS